MDTFPLAKVINGDRRKQGARTHDMQPIIEHMHFDSPALKVVISVSNRVNQRLATSQLWINDLSLKKLSGSG